MEALNLQPEAIPVDENGRRQFDAYFTAQPVADALVRCLERDCFWRGGTVLEPSAGRGAFVRATMDLVIQPTAVYVNDIDPVRVAELRSTLAVVSSNRDFAEVRGQYDLIVGNPPYSHAEAHVRHALSLRSRCGVVAFLLRLAFLESQERVPFWKEHPASKIYVLSQRPSFTGDGGSDKAAYGFFVWDKCCRATTTLEVISWR